MSKSDDLVFDAKAKFKSTVGSVSGIFENKNKDIIKAIEQGAKSGKIKIPVDMEPDTSKVEAAKKEAAKPIETPVKLKLDASEIKALQNLPTAKAKVEFLIDKKAVNDIVAKDLNNVINKAATKMNSKLQGITSKSMASLASLDKFLPNIPELSSSKHRAMMTELKKKGLSDISQNERAQIESAYRLRSYLLDSKKEMSERGKFIPPSESLVAPDASLSLEDYNKALNGLIKTSKNIVIASDLFGQLNKQLETNKRNIPVEQDVSSKTMRRLLGMGIKKNDPDYDPNNYAQYLLNQSLNKAGFSDNIDKIVANQTHKIELSVTNSHLDTIFKKSQNEGLSKKDYSELVNRYINKNLAELEKDILADDQFGEIALGSISDIKKRAETLNDSLKTRRKNKFIGLMSTYLAKGGSGINNEEFYKALLSDISEYDKDIDAEGKQKAIEQAVQKQLTEQKAAENKEEKSVPKKTTRKRTVKKKESIPAQTDVEEKDASASIPASAIESKSKPAKAATSKSARSKEKEEAANELLKLVYNKYINKKEAYKNGGSPFQYADAREKYRTTYMKILESQLLPASSFKDITGKDPFSILKAKSIYDHAHNTSRQIFGIKDSLHDLGYERDTHSEMFDLLDGMARNIITVNNMRYNNRNKSNGDTDEIAQIIKDVENQATQLEDMVRADGHSGFTLKGIPYIQEPSEKKKSKAKSQPTLEVDRKKQSSEEVGKSKVPETPISPKYKVVSAPKLAPVKNNDVIDETKNTADAMNQSADAVIEAKKKESDAVVNSNDKIAKSEEKVAIKTVSGLKNSNSNLTETPVTPPELDGLKQLSQREFGDAQKYIKVYEDTNRTIYTLTQTYKKQFDANGNLLAEGYENAIAYYDSYEKLEGEAVKLSKKINSNYAKLDTEKYKSTDKQNPNLLKKLQDDIKSDKQDLSELHRIARLNASLPDNDYMYQNFTQALRKGSAESARSLSATHKTNRDNFNVKKDTLNTDISKQISDIESLGQAGTIAAGKLQGIQKSLSTITTPAGLENVQKQITDINEQFDSNKARESALNYVHNLEQGLTGKQNVVIGTKNASDNFTGSIENGKWIGPLAGLNRDFESTSAKLDGYIADAEKLGDVGEKAADSFSTLKEHLKTCYTESGLKQIQGDMKVTQAQLTASKKQADAIKNSDIAKQYDNAIDKAKEVKSLNAELLGYKKKQSQYSKGSDTYTEIGNRITETAEAAKKANDAFEKLTQNDFVSKNSEALKNAGKNVEDYDKVVREMKQAQADVSGFDEKTIQANNKEAFTEQYTKAIEKVKELKSAMQDLYSFEAKGAKGQISSDDFISGFTDRFKNIKKLKENVDEFKKNTYQNNKDDADSVLNQLLFGNYEKAFTDSEQSMSDYENKITTLMTQAYSRQRKLSNDLYKMAGNKNYSEQEYTEKMNQRNGVQATYEALKAQIKNSGKNIDSDSLISDIKNASDLDRNNILGNLKESLSSQINDFENSLKHMQNTMNLPDGIASLKEKLESAFTFENGADNLGNFKNRMQDFYQTFDSLKGSSFIQFANEFGTAFDSLTKAENSSGKVSAYTDKLNGFVESYNDIVTKFHNKEIDTSQAQDEISELASKMQDFQKVAKNYDKTNSKGTYLEGTKGLVQDTKDVETMLTEYANSIGLTSKISSSINETTGQVKMQFADISGNVVTLTGNLEKAGNAMRIISSTASKASTGMSSFGTSIKGMVSGNFKGAIADIASYVSYFQVTMKAIQQAKQGFNDFLNFQKDLTNISYTMNLSPDQLQNLGTSAIDMAKDLSMSLDNTMDIYKIYANMNTTASEIQQTARPTAILSNLSGVDASTAADQVQGILQQFHMLEDGSTTAADASMHIVDVLDKVSGSVGIDYAKGIKIISDAVQASGQVAYDAGMSYEQLAAITAKVSERTREDGSSIGNALKTIITRTTKVGKMPQYADEVDNATLSNASASLHAIGVDVYNPDGSDRGIITVMSELKDKWDDLTDAQQAKIAFDVAATRLKASLCMKKFILE
ncbi:phage tail tape measure protein [Blautia wexlerae]|uniref:phage tail tape measure protein n=1 Tax=Blautia wexlerae TaxID=418240 RepID=UPI00156F1E0D|nr:phage tail tape measure protein [Blautia wexlerae]NSF62343.1 phage tail tape measure protein [Blautia wexlerae]